MRKKSKLFLLNGTILTLTSLFIKFSTLFFNVYISNKIDQETLGLFNLIMSIYLFFITVSTSGLNVGVTVIVSEKLALKNIKQAIQAIRTSIFLSLLFGLLSGLLILVLSKYLIKLFLYNKVSIYPLYLIAVGLPFIAMSSCINSYFSAIRKAYKAAIVQALEFIVKTIATIILLNYNITKGVDYICSSLILADVISEVFSFSIIYILFLIDIKSKKICKIKKIGQISNILYISFPIAITSCIRSGLSTLKQLIIPKQLEKFGYSTNVALSKYGIINGMVIPVIYFPAVFINSYSSLLIPEFSTYLAQKKFKAINYISNKIFKLTCAFSICISSIFIIFASDLAITLYNTTDIKIYFMIFAPLIFFIYIDTVIDSILKGLNKQLGVMICNILDLSFSVCFIYFVLPIGGFKAYIISIFLSEILNFSISLYQLIKYTKIFPNFIDWILVPMICCFISYILIHIFNFKLINMKLCLTMNILLFIIFYATSFLILNIIKRDDS